MPSRPGRACAVLLSTCCIALCLAAHAGAATVTQTFDHTGRPQSFVVPDGIDSLEIVAIGGKGGSGQGAGESGSGIGGRGARVSGAIAVEPGQRLWVQVGGNGIDFGCPGAFDDPAGAYNGGGRGGGAGGGCSYQAGGGGGASDVRVCEPGQPCDEPGDLLGRLIVAAGGGGAGRFSDLPSGAGGDALAAGETVVEPPRGPASGGGPGTDLDGGAGGAGGGSVPRAPAGAGTLGAGGAGATSIVPALAHGGGGGGGRYGGGGGGTSDYFAGGGGGGSNLVPAGGTAELDDDGSPQITIGYETEPPATVDAPTFEQDVLYADGETQTTVTTAVHDANGTQLSGLDVSFSHSDGPAVEIGSATDNGDGTYSADVTAPSERGTTTVTAQLASPPLTSPGGSLRSVARPAVTAPADGTPVTDTPAGPATVTVSGTADPLTAGVDVVCLDDDGGDDVLAVGVPVTGGAWSVVDAPLADADDEDAVTSCELIAVPSDMSADGFGDLDDESGPRLRRLLLRTEVHGDGIVSYRASTGGFTTDTNFAAFGTGCGIRMRGASVFGERWLRCGAGIAELDDQHGQPTLAVDGQPAFTPGQLAALSGGPADGTPALTVTTELAGDGSFVVTEHSPLSRCTAAEDVPASASECGPPAAAGVTATVRLVVSPSGERAEQQLSFESTDGAAHALSTSLVTETDYDETESRLGDEAGWSERDAPASVDAPPVPYSALFRGAGFSTDAPAFAVTAAAGPQSQLAFDAGVEQRYERTVPAAGTARIAHTIELVEPAGVEAAAADARAAYDVGVEIPPAPESSSDADTVTLHGTAFDRTGDVRLRVGGEPVTVGPDGGWAATVPLTVGENTVTAVVTSAFGATRGATASITRTPEPEPRQPEPGQPEPRTPEPGTPEPTLSAPTPPAARGRERPAARPLATLKRSPARIRLAQARRRGVTISLTLGAERSHVTAELRGPWGRFARVARARAPRGRLVLRLTPTRSAAAHAAGSLQRRKAVALRLTIVVRTPSGAAETIRRTIRILR